MVSLSSCPQRLGSSPAKPEIVSPPALPLMQSQPLVPVSTSAPLVPVIQLHPTRHGHRKMICAPAGAAPSTKQTATSPTTRNVVRLSIGTVLLFSECI